MADTVRELSALQALLADNIAKNVSAQDVRDFLVSAELKNLTIKTGDYTADADDQIITLNASGGTVAITLPTAVGVAAKRYWLKCVDKTNACTIETNGSETIDGAANYTFTTVQDCIEIISDGTNWLILNEYLNA